MRHYNIRFKSPISQEIIGNNQTVVWKNTESGAFCTIGTDFTIFFDGKRDYWTYGDEPLEISIQNTEATYYLNKGEFFNGQNYNIRFVESSEEIYTMISSYFLPYLDKISFIEMLEFYRDVRKGLFYIIKLARKDNLPFVLCKNLVISVLIYEIKYICCYKYKETKIPSKIGGNFFLLKPDCK